MSTLPQTDMFRTVPPVMFPMLFGLGGLGLAWLQSGIADWLGWLVTIGVAGLYLWALGLWARHGLSDLKLWLASVPGRMGLAGIGLTAMLLASVMARPLPGVATGLVAAALLGHFALALAVVPRLRANGALRSQVTPAWHLLFVGFIVGALATARLEFTSLTLSLFGVTFCLALGIYGLSLERAKTQAPPPELRPLTMIHLAPVSLFAMLSALINLPSLALLFGASAICLAGYLLIKLRWMMAGGFGPGWVAFTFPCTAFASMLLSLGDRVGVLWWAGLVVLLACSVFVPLIAGRLLRLWWAGRLPIPQ